MISCEMFRHDTRQQIALCREYPCVFVRVLVGDLFIGQIHHAGNIFEQFAFLFTGNIAIVAIFDVCTGNRWIRFHQGFFNRLLNTCNRVWFSVQVIGTDDRFYSGCSIVNSPASFVNCNANFFFIKINGFPVAFFYFHFVAFINCFLYFAVKALRSSFSAYSNPIETISAIISGLVSLENHFTLSGMNLSWMRFSE
ncbi:hypothetical protein KKP3664_000078 [Citrobacter phage KKP_3664]|nr:hypothetical protein KKP3664_000078 [Citrobacter phage KKP_3664]